MAQFFDRFDRIYVINLEERTDRRAEIGAQLGKLGLSFADDRVELFKAARPDDAGDFPSRGAHGCFLSHLRILEDAKSHGYRRIFIFEDDAYLRRVYFKHEAALSEAASSADWDMLFLGFQLEGGEMPKGAPLLWPVPAQFHVGRSHAMAFAGETIARAADYLGAMYARPKGSPEGGPMHVDAAYSWFRKAEPQPRTYLTRTELITQRASHTDVSREGKAIDRLPFIVQLRRLRQAVTGKPYG